MHAEKETMCGLVDGSNVTGGHMAVTGLQQHQDGFREHEFTDMVSTMGGVVGAASGAGGVATT